MVIVSILICYRSITFKKCEILHQVRAEISTLHQGSAKFLREKNETSMFRKRFPDSNLSTQGQSRPFRENFGLTRYKTQFKSDITAQAVFFVASLHAEIFAISFQRLSPP